MKVEETLIFLALTQKELGVKSYLCKRTEMDMDLAYCSWDNKSQKTFYDP